MPQNENDDLDAVEAWKLKLGVPGTTTAASEMDEAIAEEALVQEGSAEGTMVDLPPALTGLAETPEAITTVSADAPPQVGALARSMKGQPTEQQMLKRIDKLLTSVRALEQRIVMLEKSTDADTAGFRKTAADAVRAAGNASLPDKIAYKQLGKLNAEVTDAIKKARKLASKPAEKILAEWKTLNQADLETAIGDLLQDAGGRATIDAVMEAMGTKGDALSRRIATTAMLKRFKIKRLEGTPTSKAPARFYKLMAGLPEDHTFANNALNVFEMNKGLSGIRKFLEDGNYYQAGRVVINLPASSHLPFPRKDANRKSTWFEGFAFATLHEIGHAVDTKNGIMAGNRGLAKFGKWEDLDSDRAAEKIGAAMGFFDAFPSEVKGGLKCYLKNVLEGSEPEIGVVYNEIKLANNTAHSCMDRVSAAARTMKKTKFVAAYQDLLTTMEDPSSALQAARTDCKLTTKEAVELTRRVVEDGLTVDEAAEAMDQALRATLIPMPRIDERAVSAHPAVERCRAIRKASKSKVLYMKGPSEAAKVAIGDRVYIESYPGDWWSYSLAKRQETQVSDYQWRAPGEWFAELYAMYYLGKLAKGHDLYKWFRENVDGRPAV
ncbi:hypothetical protein [Arenibaculum pallidiluteum]|uniref:hypothetical protein n=1 Tax=Arenibaculum pallidiluteum TaxID=2812559 RepID=UPI001A95B3A5|nr:hypothetical protein [Arenibaculum pallidiluteum]